MVVCTDPGSMDVGAAEAESVGMEDHREEGDTAGMEMWSVVVDLGWVSNWDRDRSTAAPQGIAIQSAEVAPLRIVILLRARVDRAGRGRAQGRAPSIHSM